MSDKLVEMTCADFAEALAAKKSVPGGGGAAALVGSLGAALGSMTGNFTLGKAAYADVEADVERMMAELETIRCSLLELVDGDAEAFAALMATYRIPKEDEGRAAAIEEATHASAAGPFAMMEQIAHAIELLEEMGEKGSKNLLSDVACGASLCRGALEAASINVFVNTVGMKDRAYADEMEARCDALLNEYCPRADQLFATLVAGIRG